VASRRVTLVGSTPWPNELFTRQAVRSLMTAEGFLAAHRMLICDRDAKWSHDIHEQLGDAGVDMVRTPARAPNANRMRNASSDRSRPNVWIGSSRSANVTFVARLRSTSTITTTSAITKGWATS